MAAPTRAVARRWRSERPRRAGEGPAAHRPTRRFNTKPHSRDSRGVSESIAIRSSPYAASSTRDHSQGPRTEGPEQAVRIAARRCGARDLPGRRFLCAARTAVARRRAGRGRGCADLRRKDAIQCGDALLDVGRVDILAVANDGSCALALRHAIARELRLARLVAALLTLRLAVQVRRRGA